MTMRRLLLLLLLPFFAVAAPAATDTIRERRSDGTVTAFNAVKVVGLAREGARTTFLALDHRGRTGRFDAANVVDMQLAPGRRFRMEVEKMGVSVTLDSAEVVSFAEGNLQVLIAPGAAREAIPLQNVVSLQALDTTPPTVEDAVAATNAGLDAMMGTGSSASAQPAAAEQDADAQEAAAVEAANAKGRAEVAQRKKMLFSVGGAALVLAIVAGAIRAVRRK